MGSERAAAHCFSGDELDELEETMPGIAAIAIDVVDRAEVIRKRQDLARDAPERATFCDCRKAFAAV